MNNYKDCSGYEWGWITKEGVRQASGASTTVIPDKIAGIWCLVKRKGFDAPFYHEVFLDEYKKSDKGSWGERPMNMLLKLSRKQAYRMAYFDQIDNSLPEDEIITLPELFCSSIKMLQLWKCKDCGHTFYTPFERRGSWYHRWHEKLLGLIGYPVYVDCQACSKPKASKVKVVKKKIQE